MHKIYLSKQFYTLNKIIYSISFQYFPGSGRKEES